jgi:hypothetical protein
MKRNRSARILRSSLSGAAAALVGAHAIAQSPPAAEPKDNMDEVIVTGTRIASPNATSTSPVQVVTHQEMQVSGKTDITDVISQMPQLHPRAGRTSAIAPRPHTAGGVAGDLRGLGQPHAGTCERTRLGIGSPYLHQRRLQIWIRFLPPQSNAVVLTVAPRRPTAPTPSPASSTSS